MIPKRLVEIERMLAGGMCYPDILRDWVRELLDEIARLLAEMERLKKFIADYDVMEPVELRDVRHERDEARAQVRDAEKMARKAQSQFEQRVDVIRASEAEALAQVAMMLREIHDFPHRLQTGEEALACLRRLMAMAKHPAAEARALLGRLQRAEAVVGILDQCETARHETTCDCRKKALAACEEGK